MKRNYAILCLSCCLIMFFIVLTTSGICAFEHQRYFIGINGSTIKLIGDNVDYCAIRTWENISIGTYFNPKVGLELSAGYGMVVVRDWANPSFFGRYFKQYSESPYHTYLYPVGMNLHYNFMPQSRWQPFIVVGGVVMFWELKEDVGGTAQRLSGLRANMMGC